MNGVVKLNIDTDTQWEQGITGRLLEAYDDLGSRDRFAF